MVMDDKGRPVCGLCRGIRQVPTYHESGKIYAPCPWCSPPSIEKAMAAATDQRQFGRNEEE